MKLYFSKKILLSFLVLFLLFGIIFVIVFYKNIRTKIFVSLEKRYYQNSQEQKNINKKNISNSMQDSENEGSLKDVKDGRLFEDYFLGNNFNNISKKNEKIKENSLSLADIVKKEKTSFVKNFEAQILKINKETINIKNKELNYNNTEIKINNNTDFYKRKEKDPEIFAQELEKYNNQKEVSSFFPPFPYNLIKALPSEMKIGQNIYLTVEKDFSGLKAVRIELIF